MTYRLFINEGCYCPDPFPSGCGGSGTQHTTPGRSGASEIAELRGIPFSQEIGRELRARGPNRRWHRYRVFPDTIGMIGDDGPVGEPDAGPHENPPDDRPIIPSGSSPPPVPTDQATPGSRRHPFPGAR